MSIDSAEKSRARGVDQHWVRQLGWTETGTAETPSGRLSVCFPLSVRLCATMRWDGCLWREMELKRGREM
jgi:hypothetical protein